MESLPLQSLFQSKMYPSEESNMVLAQWHNGRAQKHKIREMESEAVQYYTEHNRRESESAYCKGSCITQAAKPLLMAFQLLAILPVSFHKKYCRFSHAWLSFPAFHNIIATCIALLTSVAVLFTSMHSIVNLKGTDLYTLALTAIAQFGATVAVYATGNISAAAFCSGWQSLHDVAVDLEPVNFGSIKRSVYFVPAGLILEGILTGLTISVLTDREDLPLPLPPWVAFAGSMLTNFVPNSVLFSFSVLLWISGYLFDHLNQLICDCLEQPTSEIFSPTSIGIYPQTIACKLGKLRQTHEHLCDAVRFFESAFGIQLLVIIPASGIRLVTIMYSVLVEIFGISNPNMKGYMRYQILAWFTALFRIMLIIFSGDQVMKKATGPLRALKRARCPSNSDKLNEEIDVFLSKISSFPLEIKCCSIITLNLTFLSTAIPNLITYILVLIQFKEVDDTYTCLSPESTINATSFLKQ